MGNAYCYSTWWIEGLGAYCVLAIILCLLHLCTSTIIYNSVREDLVFIVTKKKEELTLKSIFIFMVLLSKAYKEKKGLYEYLVSKKCCSSDVYLWKSRIHMCPNEYLRVLFKNHMIIQYMWGKRIVVRIWKLIFSV